MGPFAIEPVGLVGLEVFSDFKFFVQMCLEGGFHILDFTFGDEPVDDMIVALTEGRNETFILNLPNQGVFSNLPNEALVEVAATSDSTGFQGVSVGECPRVLKGMLEKRFVWQELIADAAVSGSRQYALQAMLLDEMALGPADNEALLEDLLEASRERLPRFFA